MNSVHSGPPGIHNQEKTKYDTTGCKFNSHRMGTILCALPRRTTKCPQQLWETASTISIVLLVTKVRPREVQPLV